MQSRYWCITDNVHTDQSYWQEIRQANPDIRLWAQPEMVAHLHVQAFVIYDRKKRAGGVRAMFPSAHVEMMRAADPNIAAAYANKNESWTGEWRITGIMPADVGQGKRSDLERIRDLCKHGANYVAIVDEVPSALRYFKEIQNYKTLLWQKNAPELEPIILRDWQEELFESWRGIPLKRRIFWIWSAESATGKTTTVKHFFDLNPGVCLMGTRNLSNLMHAYDEQMHRLIWFDLSRSDPLDAEISDVLEQLSNNAYVFAGKYESRMKRVSAHVVVTCNRPPIHERLPNRIVEYRLNALGQRVIDVPLIIPNGNYYAPGFEPIN